MKTLNLSQGYSVIVDDSDFEELSKHKWYAALRKHTVYATRNFRDENGKPGLIMMHRQIMGAVDKSLFVDHINHNGLDNRRENLRIVTVAVNNANRRPTVAGGKSIFKGVFWDKELLSWAAYITKDGKRHKIGNFEDDVEAARAYDAEALIFWGLGADVNFLNPSQWANA